MSRRELREQIFLMLFGMEFHAADKKEALERYLDDTCEYEMTEAERNEAIARVLAIDEDKEELDRKINAVSQSWKTDRIGKAELSILRLALYELLHDEFVPVKVSINEAVELAKRYGDAEASGFINGLLASLANQACEKQNLKTMPAGENTAQGAADDAHGADAVKTADAADVAETAEAAKAVADAAKTAADPEAAAAGGIGGEA